MRSQREETLTHCHLFPLRWLQPQPVQRHQQHSLHRARVFRLGGGLSLRGRVAHRAPQPGWSEHAQWPRHGAAGPLCGRHLPQWQTLNTEGCRFPETHTHTRAPTSLRPPCMQPLRLSMWNFRRRRLVNKHFLPASLTLVLGLESLRLHPSSGFLRGCNIIERRDEHSASQSSASVPHHQHHQLSRCHGNLVAAVTPP